MKNITTVILCGMMVATHICFSMNEEWEIMEVKSCNTRTIYSTQEPYVLNFFYKKNAEQNVCSAVLSQNNANYSIKLSNTADVAKAIKENYYYHDVLKVDLVLKLRAGQKEKEVIVKSVKEFYGPEEYHNLREAAIIAEADSIVFNLEINEEGFDQIRLYQAENIKKIREELAKYQQFIVRFKAQGKENLVKVNEYTSCSYLWWDGWKPMTMLDVLHYGWVGMAYSPDPSPDPSIIDIDLDEDKKSESHYKANKLVGRALVAATIVSIVYLLREKIFMLKDAIFGDSEQTIKIPFNQLHLHRKNYDDEDF